MLGKGHFQFAGYISEKLQFADSNGKQQYMLRYDYLGGNVILPCTAEEYAVSPEENTLCRVYGEVRIDKKTGRVSLKIQGVQLEGEKDWKAPSENELLAGVMFSGEFLIISKDARERGGETFLSVSIALFGGAYKFTQLDTASFAAFPESGVINLSGKVETKIASVEDKGRWIKRCECTLIPQKVAPFKKQAPAA